MFAFPNNNSFQYMLVTYTYKAESRSNTITSDSAVLIPAYRYALWAELSVKNGPKTSSLSVLQTGERHTLCRQPYRKKTSRVSRFEFPTILLIPEVYSQYNSVTVWWWHKSLRHSWWRILVPIIATCFQRRHSYEPNYPFSAFPLN